MILQVYTIILTHLNDIEDLQISNETVNTMITNGTLFNELRKLQNNFCKSLPSEDDQKELLAKLQELVNSDIDEKLYSGSNGIRLLIAYLLELLNRSLLSDRPSTYDTNIDSMIIK